MDIKKDRTPRGDGIGNFKFYLCGNYGEDIKKDRTPRGDGK